MKFLMNNFQVNFIDWLLGYLLRVNLLWWYRHFEYRASCAELLVINDDSRWYTQLSYVLSSLECCRDVDYRATVLL